MNRDIEMPEEADLTQRGLIVAEYSAPEPADYEDDE